MNGYKIVLLKAIFMLYKLPECERVCSGICNKRYETKYYTIVPNRAVVGALMYYSMKPNRAVDVASMYTR